MEPYEPTQTPSPSHDQTPRAHATSLVRVNIGCGSTPIAGWLNFDNSWTVRLSRAPFLVEGLVRVGVLSPRQQSFATIARREQIRWADASRKIPLADGSASVVYSSHMLEHLDRSAAGRFLDEARRVLVVGGVLRIGVPDLAHHVREYLEDGDADRFVAGTLLAVETGHALIPRVRMAITGHRDHHWMYDGRSLVKLVADHGFADTTIMPAGESLISDPGALNLSERAGETVFVEARKVA